MKLRLDLRLSQKLIMTPQLQQAIKLLQLSRLELQQSLTQHLLENPLLDEVQTDVEEAEAAAAEGKTEDAATPSAQETTEEGGTPDRKSTRLNSSHSQQSRMPSSA